MLTNWDLNNFTVYLMVCCRMAGAIFLNPILGRRNVPVMVGGGLSLALAFFSMGTLPPVWMGDAGALELILLMVRELCVGFVMGFVVQLFLSIFHIGGGLIDLQVGLGMATLYDPASQSQISIVGNLTTILFTLTFFITNSHLRFMALAVKSYELVPLPMGPVPPALGIRMVEWFSHILVFALQLALPVVVTQIITEVAVGILMRIVPNINVFVVNIQVKLAVGILVLFTIIPLLVRYMERLNGAMLSSIHEGLQAFS